MHRYVWMVERGPIPPKYHVHHIDGNKSNNKIENLTLLHASDHTRLHALDYIEKNKEKFTNHLHNIRPKALESKKTERVKEIQRKATLKNFKDNKKVKGKCLICEAEIEYTIGFKKKVYCGKKCASSTQVRKDKKNRKERERYRLLHENKH